MVTEAGAVPWNAWPVWWTTRTQVIPATYPAGDLEGSVAFQAACDLVFLGTSNPAATGTLLHQRRREFKARQSRWLSRPARFVSYWWIAFSGQALIIIGLRAFSADSHSRLRAWPTAS